MSVLRTGVTVIGGGPAGATVSRLLSQSGVKNILVEKDSRKTKPCGGGLVSNAFNELDIPASLITRRVNTIKVVSPSGTGVDISLRGGFLAIVERGNFDQTLRELALEEGTMVIEGEARRLFFREKRPVVTVASPEGEREIEADYAVATDGVNSSMRRIFLSTFPSRVPALYAILEDYATDICEFHFDLPHTPAIYAWIFPHHGGASVGVVGKESAEVSLVKEYLEEFLRKRGYPSNGKIRGYHIPLWDESLYYRNKVFFAGDAAGQVLPFTYEGIYYAMKSAECVAEAIVKRTPSLYKRRWKTRFKKRFLLMRTLQNILLRDSNAIEKVIGLHRDEKIQNASLRLWLQKDPGRGSLLRYVYLLKEYIRPPRI